ncbi:hypothetical protein BC629DRAFT_488919 [Irpex lacteus]|nr:hypothetical protein BC629DRAFT_488919 [Irpex lacteus]
MEDLVNDEGLDLEALQAQIDLSLAQTQNLVATWLKPRQSASAGSSRINQEKDIQELLKRPPRRRRADPCVYRNAGPRDDEAQGEACQQEEDREVEDIGTKTADQSDDEEESRAGAIKKKARVDPFAAKGKKKQTGNNSVQNALPTKSKPSPPHTPPRATSPSAEAQPTRRWWSRPIKPRTKYLQVLQARRPRRRRNTKMGIRRTRRLKTLLLVKSAELQHLLQRSLQNLSRPLISTVTAHHLEADFTRQRIQVRKS